MRALLPVFGSATGLLVLLVLALPSAAVLSGCDSNECQDDRITSDVIVEFEGTEDLQATCEIQRELPCGSDSNVFDVTVPNTANLGEVTEALVSCVINEDSQGTLRLRMLVRNTSGEFGEFDTAESDQQFTEVVVSIP